MPTVPKIVRAKEEPVDAIASASARTDDENILKMEVEIPYVPAAQRNRAAVPTVDDTIVVVGQPKKKRKRAAAERGEANGDAEGRERAAVKEEAAEVEAFDYSSVPNILDDVPIEDAAEGPSSRKKKKHAKGEDSSGYRAYGGC